MFMPSFYSASLDSRIASTTHKRLEEAPEPLDPHAEEVQCNKKKNHGECQSECQSERYVSILQCTYVGILCTYLFWSTSSLGQEKLFFGHLFFNRTNVFCAKKRVGHACICPRMVTGSPVLKLYPPQKS